MSKTEKNRQAELQGGNKSWGMWGAYRNRARMANSNAYKNVQVIQAQNGQEHMTEWYGLWQIAELRSS